ncbi:SET domain-containing protein [Schizophyllum commune H4-8]|uniref:Uncharacterized protein n=1 Tax=Schizophyllum commune (strain H4-8 / FGSC 9210) TaxID=578458 RepID=D8PJV2_SCHCM|nr:SET domain-containing protein [Schizophyllum commune H4-8]KAI5894002.1 SET domain-containing protein [Schizophyllum commune H4-8]
MGLTESPKAVDLKNWLQSHGGGFHQSVRLVSDDSETKGINAVALRDIPASEPVVWCPIDLIVTPQKARESIAIALGLTNAVRQASENWSERQSIGLYLSLHSLLPNNPALSHRPYVDLLPPASTLRAAIHFTEDELAAFRGTNLYGATIDRRRLLEAEWQKSRDLLRTCKPELADLLTWDLFAASTTHYTSRAFPSSMLEENPSLQVSSQTEPVLIPGVDSLNHYRARPVTWLVETRPVGQRPVVVNERVPADAPPFVAVVPLTETPAGAEIFNNYGAKPNAELILGYGFTLEDNTDDTIVLKLGGGGESWEIGRRWNEEYEQLWRRILTSVAAGDGGKATFEDRLEAAEMLMDMVQQKLQALPDATAARALRPEVAVMLKHYVDGQREILQSLHAFAEKQEQEAIAAAKEQGIELVFDEEEEGA